MACKDDDGESEYSGPCSKANDHAYLYVSPLELPLRKGWKRVKEEGKGEDEPFHYVTPCEQKLMNMEEVSDYLLGHPSVSLAIDNFSVDADVMLYSPVDNYYLSMLSSVCLDDVSGGKERLPIPCINIIDSTHPAPFTYITRYTKDPSVTVATDRGFLVSCDCVGDCSTSCVCRQLTLDEGKGLGRTDHTYMGYTHRRLMKQHTSGVYECNQFCKCSSGCGNRVIQNGVQLRLAVYKTLKMGWGVVTLDDIPQGAFVACYLGLVSSDESANERGVHYGDEYMLDLDYIEVLEHAKEGYESDVNEVEPDPLYLSAVLNDSSSPCSSVDDDGYYVLPISQAKRPRLSSSESTPAHTHTSSHTFSTSLSASNSLNVSIRCSAQRRFYQEDHCYIVDSKSEGNICRFINHSCSANLFVQNVFVDSHDLRFPWIAMFAKQTIKAGSEVFWDYNYVVGSMEGKEITCYCGASNCRGRLL